MRRSPRSLALWTAAVVVAVVTAVVVGGDLAALRARARDLGPEVEAVVAARDLPVGTVLEADDVTVRKVHRTQAPEHAVDDRAAALGRVVVVALVRGAYLAPENLADADRGSLDAVVPAGHRALRVHAHAPDAVTSGTIVDVLAVLEGVPGATTVAFGATVLGVTTAEPGAIEGGVGGDVPVTLLVRDDETTDVVEAAAIGGLWLAVVPPEAAGGP